MGGIQRVNSNSTHDHDYEFISTGSTNLFFLSFYGGEGGAAKFSSAPGGTCGRIGPVMEFDLSSSIYQVGWMDMGHMKLSVQ